MDHGPESDLMYDSDLLVYRGKGNPVLKKTSRSGNNGRPRGSRASVSFQPCSCSLGGERQVGSGVAVFPGTIRVVEAAHARSDARRISRRRVWCFSQLPHPP